jgi:hypothetical protein
LQAFSYTFFFTLYEQSGIVLNGYWWGTLYEYVINMYLLFIMV